MCKRLLIGSNNRGKAVELAQLLEGLPWNVIGLDEFPDVSEPVEDGLTFEANALKKARYFSDRLDVHCVADDSGLVVDALDGAPGVYSARYAGEACDPKANNAKLLDALARVPATKRTARFVCCAAFARPGGATHSETGVVEGRIAFERHGPRGFGYDPLFIPEGHSITFGEMDPAQKHAISHRGRALAKLRAYLESLP